MVEEEEHLHAYVCVPQIQPAIEDHLESSTRRTSNHSTRAPARF